MSALLRDPLLKIRPMSSDDLDAVMAVETMAYPFPWTRGIFSDCLRVGYHCLVSVLDEQIIGFCVMSMAAGEAHILNICVAPGYQGKGLGRRLLDKMMGTARKHEVDTVLLEVRASNQAAIQLYLSSGFNEIGVRRGYYPNGEEREDAILLAYTLI